MVVVVVVVVVVGEEGCLVEWWLSSIKGRKIVLSWHVGFP